MYVRLTHVIVDNMYESLYTDTIEEQAKEMTDQVPLWSIVQDSVYTSS